MVGQNVPLLCPYRSTPIWGFSSEETTQPLRRVRIPKWYVFVTDLTKNHGIDCWS